jgi:8-oxo-dGTP diphosphatase
MIERPKIGVGVCMIKDGKVLLGKRLNAHGQGTWAFPGGHLEFGETVVNCAKREVAEETGMKISNIRKGPYTEDLFIAVNKHYITLLMIADWQSGEPVILEPDKCQEWRWFAWDQFPSPLFRTFESLRLGNIKLQDYF